MLAKATIAALATGRPPSAIAVLRVSGPQAFALGKAMCGTVPPSHRAAMRTIRRDTGEIIDRALVLAFAAPRSATGEDVIELHLHGGQAVVAAALDAALAFDGVRLAIAGEFTRRAFDNARLDLTQVEGLADLLAATTEAQRAQALRGTESALGQRAGAWRTTLLGELVETEARLDFADEGDVLVASPNEWALRNVAKDMRSLLEHTAMAERVREGLTVVLAGPPNAGKSSLLNALVCRDAAIVASTPGTTRDPIEVEMNLAGMLVRLIDTAGLRDSIDPIEREGIARARAWSERADLILNLGSSERLGWSIRTRIDLTGESAGEYSGTSHVSSVTGEGVDSLRSRLAAWAQTYRSGEAAIVSHARQAAAVADAAGEVEQALGEADVTLRAEHLRLAVRAIGRLTGAVDVEDVLDGVFSRFCLGK